MLLSNFGTIETPGRSATAHILDGRTRARLRTALFNVLPHADKEKAAQYSVQVEACATALSGSQYTHYLQIMGRVIYNLQSNGSYIVHKYPVSRVCKLSHKRLDAGTTHARRDEHVEARLRALAESAKQEAALASSMASSIRTDSAIKCPKCHTQDGITRITAQMNSGDEGMKTRCLCVCGHRWQMA